jgi:hypothetical protein
VSNVAVRQAGVDEGALHRRNVIAVISRVGKNPPFPCSVARLRLVLPIDPVVAPTRSLLATAAG